MIKSNFLTFFILTLVSIFGVAAQSDCSSKKNNKNLPANTNSIQNTVNKMPENQPPTAGDVLKTLAEGSYGEIKEPFLFVARDAETYAKLKNLPGNLPPASEINFGRQAVVAAFAGTKNTGGYSVEIKKTGETIFISVNEPPPGALVTEALTMPYKIAAVPIAAENSLNLNVSENWKKAAREYKVSSGAFESSGGITGRAKSFMAEGAINVYQFGNLITLDFNLSGAGAEKNRQLTEMASGVLSDGQISLTRIDAGSFSEGPKPPLKISGTVSNKKLILTFEPLKTKIPDSFQVSGKLEAVRN